MQRHNENFKRIFLHSFAQAHGILTMAKLVTIKKVIISRPGLRCSWRRVYRCRFEAPRTKTVWATACITAVSALMRTNILSS